MLIGSIHRLSHVNRYSSIPTLRKENVAEHTFYVGMYSYLMAKDLLDRYIPVDVGTLLSRAMVHDIDESHTGDFLRTVKYATPELKNALDKVSKMMIEKISTELGVDIFNDWKSAKDDTLEGAILEVADFACVVSYVWEEYTSGNKHVLKIFPEVRDYLVKILEDQQFEKEVKPYVSDIVKFIERKLQEELPPRAKRVRRLTAVSSRA